MVVAAISLASSPAAAPPMPSATTSSEPRSPTSCSRIRGCSDASDLTRPEASLQPRIREHDVGERGSLLVVADGMGGAAAGELASEMAATTIYDQMTKMWGAEPEPTAQRFAYRLKEAVEVANSHIHAYAKAHPEVRGMGTTTTAVGVLGDHVFLTQVGDSRA